MGADMLLSVCAIPVDYHGTQLRVDLALPVLRQRIAALPDAVLEEVADWFFDDEVDIDITGWQELVRDRLRRCLVVFEESRRDTAELCLDGRPWLFAGGMSWGDAPSDAYKFLVGLAIAGVTDDPIGIDELAKFEDATSGEEG